MERTVTNLGSEDKGMAGSTFGNHFKIMTWGIAIVILIYGIYTFAKSIKIYSVEQLYSEIANIDPKHCKYCSFC